MVPGSPACMCVTMGPVVTIYRDRCTDRAPPALIVRKDTSAPPSTQDCVVIIPSNTSYTIIIHTIATGSPSSLPDKDTPSLPDKDTAQSPPSNTFSLPDKDTSQSPTAVEVDSNKVQADAGDNLLQCDFDTGDSADCSTR